MKFQTDTVVKIVRTSLLVTAWFCLVRSNFVKSFSVQFRRITTVWLSVSGHAREFNFCDDSGSARATGYNCRQIVVRNGVRSHRDLLQSVSLGNIWQVNHLRALNIENYSSTIIILNVMAWWHYTLWQVLCCTCEDFREFSRFQNHADLYFSLLLGLYGLLFAIKPVILHIWTYAFVELLENTLLAVLSPGRLTLTHHFWSFFFYDA